MEKNSLQFIKQRNPLWFDLLLPLYIVLSCWYLIWVYAIAIDWYIWMALPLLLAEVYRVWFAVTSLITARVIALPVFRSTSGKAKVDIFIPTYNEPLEVLGKTILSAKRVRNVNQVLVLDDGRRRWVKDFCSIEQVHYLARGSNEHAKAGNMNYGLTHSKADFIITLDADHVPEVNFIERTVGYFADPKLAFIQTPQTFYNLDSFQHRFVKGYPMWNEQSMFYDSIQPAKNIFNAGFFCGSSAIWRREAIDSVGGFATGTATEDIHTAIRVHSKKWKSLYLPEVLARGLAPADLKEYHKQRVRWGAGSLGLLLRTKDSPLVISGLTVMQRICYINSTLAYAQGYVKLLYWVLPIIIIFSGQNPFRLPFLSFLAVYLPYLVFSFWLTRLYSRNSYHPLFTEQYNIANIFSNLESLKGIVRVQKKFAVSIKKKNKQENSFVFLSLIIIACVMLIAQGYGLYYWYVKYNFSLSYMLQDTTISGMFWNLYNLIFLSIFLKYVYTFNDNKRKTLACEQNLKPESLSPVPYPLSI